MDIQSRGWHQMIAAAEDMERIGMPAYRLDPSAGFVSLRVYPHFELEITNFADPDTDTIQVPRAGSALLALRVSEGEFCVHTPTMLRSRGGLLDLREGRGWPFTANAPSLRISGWTSPVARVFATYELYGSKTTTSLSELAFDAVGHLPEKSLSKYADK
jgi:hypothetical protein